MRLGVIRPIGVRAGEGVEDENRFADLGPKFLARDIRGVAIVHLEDEATMDLGTNMVYCIGENQ